VAGPAEGTVVGHNLIVAPGSKAKRATGGVTVCSGGGYRSQDGLPMKLSRTVAYAVRATLALAQSETDGPVPCSKLAAEGKMPERFLLQILRSLVTHGILRSTRGVDGGYALVRPANEISLLEVIEAIEGPYDSTTAMGEALPADSQEMLRDALNQVTTTTRKQLEAIKLSQLLKPPE
jgi:Rrf2 family protein